MTTKDTFNNLLKEKGYASLHDFTCKNDIDYGNMYKRISGKTQKIEILFAFKLANILKVPVDDIIKIFYPNEYAENQSIVNS